MSLDDVRYDEGIVGIDGHRHRATESALAGYLQQARALLSSMPAGSLDDPPLDVGGDFEQLRWFWLPEEVVARR